MAIRSWLCTSSTKSSLVKIVHPGGHVELHDRPLLASEIMQRNPRCCVAHPNVFQQPWAIVAPNTTLLLGQKFFVVPISTVRKLQRISHKRSPSSHSSRQQTFKYENESKCWFFNGKNKDEESGRRGEEADRGSCCVCLTSSTKIKANGEETTRNSKEGSFEALKKIKGIRGSPKSRASFEYWQPSLESIHEE